MQKRFLLWALWGLVVLALAWPAVARQALTPPTVVYLVRHAEKTTVPGLSDPPLTPAGAARARQLSHELAPLQPAALFTTDTRRTRATLAPLAQAVQLSPQLYDAQKPAALAARISRDYAGDTVVVVGHSNTLLPLLKALGAQPPVAEIKDNEFDYLFEVSMQPGKPSRVKVSRYGNE